MADTRLTLARRQLADALGCAEAVPDVIDGPCLVIQPAQPYIDGIDRTYGRGDVRMRMDVFAFVELDDNTIAAQQLDDLIVQVLTDLPAGWGIDSIGQPGSFTNGDWLHHGIQITVSAHITAL